MLVQRDKAGTGEPRARNPWAKHQRWPVGGWRLLLGDSNSPFARSASLRALPTAWSGLLAKDSGSELTD